MPTEAPTPHQIYNATILASNWTGILNSGSRSYRLSNSDIGHRTAALVSYCKLNKRPHAAKVSIRSYGKVPVRFWVDNIGGDAGGRLRFRALSRWPGLLRCLCRVFIK